MRAVAVIVFGFQLIWSDCQCQLVAHAPARANEFSFDAGLLSAGVAYSHATGPAKLVGVGAGVGFEFNIRMVAGERGGKASGEIAHLELFERFEPPGRWQYDVGLRAAADQHAADVHSEMDMGGFLGGYIAPMWGWRYFRIGPRLEAGPYWSAAGPTVGIFVTPLMARFIF